MEEKVKELQKYFVEKIVNGEYDIVEAREHTCKIVIDGFTFNLWTSNKDFAFSTYDGMFNTMGLEFNSGQRKKAYSIIEPHIKEFRSTELYEMKKKELERLENELKKLSND